MTIAEIQRDSPNKAETIDKYQKVCLKAWSIIVSRKGMFELEALHEFLELAFDP